MRHWWISLPTAALLAAGPAQATTVVDSLFFAALGQNPYQPGPSVSWTDRREESVQLNRTDGPTIRFPPAPSPLFVRAGVRTEGFGGISLETSFNSGRLDLRYPVASSLDIPDANAVRAGGLFSLSLGAEARALFDLGDLSLASASMFRNGGRSFGGGSGLMQPNIRTTFPTLSARLDAFYQQRNSAFIEGCGGLGFGIEKCGDIVSGDLPSFPRLQQTIASFGPQGISVLPGVLDDVGYSFGTAIPIGNYASLTINYPSVATNGGLDGATRLRSFGEQKLVELEVDVDQLISNFVLQPLLLPPLNGDFGPAKYDLLQMEASLFATIYQEFSYDPRLRVNLAFDQAVQVGNSGPVYEVNLRAGEALPQLRTLNPFAGELNVRPTYFLDGNLVSETGVGFGAGVDAKALRLRLGGLDTGYAAQASEETVFARLKLFGEQFAPEIRPIAGADFTIDLRSPFEFETADLFTSVGDTVSLLGTPGRFSVPLVGTVNGSPLDLGFRDGSLFYADGTPVPSSFAYTYATQDIFFRPDNTSPISYEGSSFEVPELLCARCFAAPLPGQPINAIILLGDGTLIKASDAAPDIALLGDGPSFFGGTDLPDGITGNRITALGPISPELRELLGLAAVPTPAAAGLFGLSLLLLGTLRRRG
jgi:hypothetical protein